MLHTQTECMTKRYIDVLRKRIGEKATFQTTSAHKICGVYNANPPACAAICSGAGRPIRWRARVLGCVLGRITVRLDGEGLVATKPRRAMGAKGEYWNVLMLWQRQQRGTADY